MAKYTRWAAGVAALALLGACEHGDPVSNAGGQFGQASLLTASASSTGLPSGTTTSFTSYGGFSTAVTNAFSRKATQFGPYWDATNHWWFWDNATLAATSPFAGPATNAPISSVRVSPASGTQFYDPRVTDPRGGCDAANAACKPKVIERDTVAGAPRDAFLSGFEIYPPGSDGDDQWEIYTVNRNLVPGTTYTWVLVNYKLKVVGTLDQEERMLTGAVTQPDTLYINNGTGRDSTDLGAAVANWSGSPATCGRAVKPLTNPIIWAREATTATSTSRTLDKCVHPGAAFYGTNDFANQAKSMVGRNDGQPYDLPNYNYLEVWKGDYGTGKLVNRTQIATDLSSIAAAINNTQAPFPAPLNGRDAALGTADNASSYPLTNAQLATMAGAIGTPDSVRVVLTNLQPLSTGAYKVWYMHPSSGTAVLAKGRVKRISGGAVAPAGDDTTTLKTSFNGGTGTITFTSERYLTTIAPKTYADSLYFVVVSKEDNAAATTPSASQILWVGIFKIPPGSAGGTMTFGTFNNGANKVRFIPQGTTAGGLLGDTVTILVDETVGGVTSQVRKTAFQGSVIEMRFNNLQRPPIGYKYTAYLRRRSDVTPVDTSLVLIGGLTDASDNSLDDADVSDAGGNLTPTGIVFAKSVYDAHAAGHLDAAGAQDQLCGYDQFRVYLEAKNGVEKTSPTIVFSVNFPDKVKKAYRCQ